MIELLKFDNVERVLQTYGERIVKEYKESLSRDDRRASGKLIDGVKYIYQRNANEYAVSLNLADYWKYVEYDTKPHYPPKSKILEWIRIKPILPHPDKNGKLPTEEQLAFLIGRAMAGESPNQANCKNPNGGTTGTHNLENTLDSLERQFTKDLIEALDKDLEGSFEIILAALNGQTNI